MAKYTKGDKVRWQSPLDKRDVSVAVFVGYDAEGFPNKDCLLAIPIGVKRPGQKRFTQIFRWPLRLVEPA